MGWQADIIRTCRVLGRCRKTAPPRLLIYDKLQRVFLVCGELVFWQRGGAAAAGANAHLECVDGNVCAGLDLVLLVLHGKQLPIGVGLHAQLEGSVHRAEIHGGLPVGEPHEAAIAAVAAFLGLDIGLRHIRKAAIHPLNLGMRLHIAVGFAVAAHVGDSVESLRQTEHLGKPGQVAATQNALEATGHQHIAYIFKEITLDIALLFWFNISKSMSCST